VTVPGLAFTPKLWLRAGLIAALLLTVFAWSLHERAIGAWKAETKAAKAYGDSVRRDLETWQARYRAARRDSARVADSLDALERLAAAHVATVRELTGARRELALTLRRDATTADSNRTLVATVGVLDSALAASETARRADSTRAELLRVDRDRWRSLADTAARDLAAANLAIARLTHAVAKAPVRDTGGRLVWAGAGLIAGVLVSRM